MFYARAEDAVVKRIEDRVAAWTMLPPGNAEGMQVLHYVVSVRLNHNALKSRCLVDVVSWQCSRLGPGYCSRIYQWAHKLLYRLNRLNVRADGRLQQVEAYPDVL
jgi:hypothetical protein